MKTLNLVVWNFILLYSLSYIPMWSTGYLSEHTLTCVVFKIRALQCSTIKEKCTHIFCSREHTRLFTWNHKKHNNHIYTVCNNPYHESWNKYFYLIQLIIHLLQLSSHTWMCVLLLFDTCTLGSIVFYWSCPLFAPF